MTNPYPINQRRYRSNVHMRELAATVLLNHKQFIQPLFIDESISTDQPIATLEGISSHSSTTVLTQIAADVHAGCNKFLLFPVPKNKAETAFQYDFIIDVIKAIRQQFGNSIWIAADLCLCAYTTHGHCGILHSNHTRVLNDATVQELSRYALLLAEAGADCIAPSDMMDGRIAAIRQCLNNNGFDAVSIMSYSAKFSSHFYGPFRDACRSTPQPQLALQGRSSYQLSCRHPQDALQTAWRDAAEGADMVMVKPALAYLDIIALLKQELQTPLAAYHVSGEYQSLQLLAAQSGTAASLLHIEAWTAIARAGAGIIISYAARHAKKWIDAITY